MSAIRQVVISTIVFAMLPPALLRASDTVQYVGGTVKSIPIDSIGTLNLDGTKELRFDYGESNYKLPYEQITGTEITKSETRHILGKIPVPSSLIPGRKKETLSISYKDAAGVPGTLNFELPAREASAVSEIIATKKTAPPQTAAQNQPDEWWGDRYWKTLRNQATWEAGATTAAKTAPAALSAPK